MCNHPPTEVRARTHGKPVECIARPDKSGEDLFLRANTLLYEGESFTHRFDSNTVGPVPVASGDGSRTLTHCAAHVPESGQETKVGVPETSDILGDTTSGVSRDQMVKAKKSGAMPKSCHFWQPSS